MGQFNELLRKDTLCLWRSSAAALASFMLAFTLIVLASFAAREALIPAAEMTRVFSLVHWLVILFAGVLALHQAFAADNEEDALVAIFLSRVDPSLVFFSKWLVQTIYLLLLSLVVTVTEIIFLGVNLSGLFLPLLLICTLFVSGFSAVGALLSCLSARSQVSNILLPILLFPLIIPLLCGAVFLSSELLLRGAIPTDSFWFTFVCVYDILSVVLSYTLFPYLFAD